MSVNDKTENRGTHGVSSSMLDTLVSSSENPLSLDRGSVNSRVYVHGKRSEQADGCRLLLLTCDKIKSGGENTRKISYGVDRQRSDEQRNGTVRIRKATDGRSNAPQRNGIATICHERHSNGIAM